MTKLRAVELFAGVGGFRLALSAAGIEVVWSNQWEPGSVKQWASKVYESHFGAHHHSNEDIKTVLDKLENDPNLVPDFDLLVGGFPCQDYSVAKSLSASKGIEGKKGVLWWEIYRLISMRKPRYILLENVDRLISSPAAQKGRDFAVMLASLASLGYTVSWRVLNAADFGHPQKRKRTFIFAHQGEHLIDIFTAPFPVSEQSPVREFELDEDLLRISNSFNLGGKTSLFQAAGTMQKYRVRTWKFKAKKTESKNLSDILVPSSEVPDEFWVQNDDLNKWEHLKGAKSLTRVGQNGFKYSYSEGSMVFPDSLDRPARTIVTGEGGATPSRFKHVIRQDGKLRRLVPVELERANEFPDDWTKVAADSGNVPDSRRAFLMGNALVVGLVTKLAKEIRKSHEAQ